MSRAVNSGKRGLNCGDSKCNSPVLLTNGVTIYRLQDQIFIIRLRCAEQLFALHDRCLQCQTLYSQGSGMVGNTVCSFSCSLAENNVGNGRYETRDVNRDL